MNDTKPEAQTMSGCAEKMSVCRSEIFGDIEDKHITQMKAIGEVNETVSYIKGRMDGQAATPAANSSLASVPIVSPPVSENEIKLNWKQVIVDIFIAWGPQLVFMAIVGLIVILKSQGLM